MIPRHVSHVDARRVRANGPKDFPKRIKMNASLHTAPVRACSRVALQVLMDCKPLVDHPRAGARDTSCSQELEKACLVEPATCGAWSHWHPSSRRTPCFGAAGRCLIPRRFQGRAPYRSAPCTVTREETAVIENFLKLAQQRPHLLGAWSPRLFLSAPARHVLVLRLEIVQLS